MGELITNTVDCPVKDVLHLVRQDSIEKLRSALLDVIDRFQPGGEIYLYEQGYSLYDSSKQSFSPVLLDSRCKGKKKKVVKLQNNKEKNKFESFTFLPTEDYVQVFSIEAERSNRGLLITINSNIIDENYVNTLLDAYNNQVYLLRNKDTDSLTGLYNRLSFDSKLEKIHNDLKYEKRSNDETKQYYFAMLDIDYFKRINDEFGHIYGDEILLLFSNAIKNTFRDIDLLFRYGGEEFAALLKDVSAEQAQSILERFRKSIEEINFPLNNKVTVSIGFCAFTNNFPLATIIERADKALYYSKNNGRNKVSYFEALLEKKEIEDIVISEGDIELF